MSKRDDWLKEYISTIYNKIKEYYGKPVNYIELQALIQRFVKNNPEADPTTIDWVAYYDPSLDYSEMIQQFKEAYPYYKWDDGDTSLTSYDEDRYYDELLNYLIKQAEELPQKLRARLVRELAAELEIPTEKAEVEEKTEEKPAEEKPKRIIINLEMLAKYHLLNEARDVASAFTFEELDKDIYDRAAERVIEAAERGVVSSRYEDPLKEMLSYPIAIGIIVYLDNEWLTWRYSSAEAKRVERSLAIEHPEVLEFVAKRLLTTVERADDRYGEYKLKYHEYLKAIKLFDLRKEPRWKLVNRVVEDGWVYINVAELASIVRGAAQSIILKKIKDSPRHVPKRIKDVADSLKPRLDEIISRIRGDILAVESIAPCMKAIEKRIIAGDDVSHFENFALTAYLLNIGKSVDDIIEIFKNREDFDEKIARYHIEHIAGMRGGRKRYIPPSCSRLKSLGICFEDGKYCPKWIKNPLQYRPNTPSKTTSDTP